MNPFRKSREFSLYRQMVFGDRAGSPDAPNPLHALHTSGSGSPRAARRYLEAGADPDTAAQSESETE